MALRGTLKDFGIADILQLIGHQGKSGVLTLKNGDQQVDVYFVDGAVMRAEPSTRDRRDLLGRMLVRAEVLSEEQIGRALEAQKRTLKRLGQILLETGAVERKVLSAFMRLQTTETLYRLFFWNSGSYEFNQRDVTSDTDFEPIKAESILMEGFRQLDEWPSIRRHVTSYGLVFVRARELDAPVAPSGDELGLDDAFGELGAAKARVTDPALKNIGQTERLVYQLVGPERDVQKLIDLSRLGEFETCKAIERLASAGFLQATRQLATRRPSAESTVGGISAPREARWAPAITRLVLSGALLAGALVLVRTLDVRWLSYVGLRQPWGYSDSSVQAALSPSHEQKIGRALDVYRAATGQYPERLEELVDRQLLAPRDLRFPWQQPYVYRRQGPGYELLRPLY
jgi:hypothetical protein